MRYGMRYEVCSVGGGNIHGLISIEFLFRVIAMNYFAISTSTFCCCTFQNVRRLSRIY